MNLKTRWGITGRQLGWLLVSLLVVILDQLTKYLADEYLSYGQPARLLPVLDFTLLYNPGAAFSFLADAGGWQRWFLTLIASSVSLVLLVWIARLKSGQALLAAALALILGGAIGNLYDRVTLGYVIDFVHLHYGQYYFPAFNVADSAVTLGAILLIWDMFANPEGQRTAAKDKAL